MLVFSVESGKALCIIWTSGRQSSIAFIVWYGASCHKRASQLAGASPMAVHRMGTCLPFMQCCSRDLLDALK